MSSGIYNIKTTIMPTSTAVTKQITTKMVTFKVILNHTFIYDSVDPYVCIFQPHSAILYHSETTTLPLHGIKMCIKIQQT